jgi:hypothetical protein
MIPTDFVHPELQVIRKRVLRMGLAPGYGIDAEGIDLVREPGARPEGRGIEWLSLTASRARGKRYPNRLPASSTLNRIGR